jgi:hypothetical protein
MVISSKANLMKPVAKLLFAYQSVIHTKIEVLNMNACLVYKCISNPLSKGEKAH